MHTLTRESQEVTVGLVVPAKPKLVRSVILSTAIPHSGQLNNTISTLLTPTKFGVPVKSNVISNLERVVSS